MKLHTFLSACLLPLVFVFGVTAQGAGVVVESVDEDIVEEAAPPAAVGGRPDKTADKDAAAAESVSAGQGFDLDALLSEDDDDDLLVEEKPAVKKAGADPAADTSSASADKLAGGETTDGGQPDVSGAAAVQKRGDIVSDSLSPPRSGRQAASVAKVDSAALGPAVIEDGKTINFAQNLKDYKSPRLAMLLSLLVPGLGQAYSRSYVKAGAFVAVEAAAIGVAAYFNSKGKSEKKKAYEFADKHFDTTMLKSYGDRLEKEFEERGLIDQVLYSLPYESYDNDFWAAARDKQPYFYDIIREDFFTPGWRDNEPDLADILEALSNGGIVSGGKYMLADTASTNPTYFYWIRQVGDEASIIGYSSHQNRYDRMMKDANSYHDYVNYTLYVLLVNHIASAIDAGFTARAHNARLLGEEKSVWNRLSVEQQYVFTGSEVSPGVALRVRF